MLSCLTWLQPNVKSTIHPVNDELQKRVASPKIRRIVRSLSLSTPSSTKEDISNVATTKSLTYIPPDTTDMSRLRLYIITWNMNGTIPTCSLETILGNPSWPSPKQPYHNCHLIIINTQECEKSLEKAVIFSSHKLWESMIQFHIGIGYEHVVSQAMVGLHTAIYVMKGFGHCVSQPMMASLATGAGNIVGNKGAVGISLKFGEISLLFINAHLAAHQEKAWIRNMQFHKINSQLSLKGYSKLDALSKNVCNRFDYTFFAGDLNYRIQQTKEYVEKHIKAGNLDVT